MGNRRLDFSPLNSSPVLSLSNTGTINPSSLTVLRRRDEWSVLISVTQISQVLPFCKQRFNESRVVETWSVTVTFPQQLGGRAKVSKKQSKRHYLKLGKNLRKLRPPLTTVQLNVSWYRHAYRSRRNDSTFIKTMLSKGELDYGNENSFNPRLVRKKWRSTTVVNT